MNMVMEVIIFCVCGWFFNSYFLFPHPLVLGGGMLIFMSCVSGMLCYFGPLFSFSCFLVMSGGILIVFAYTISLIPFDKEESSKEGEYILNKEEKKWKGLKFIFYNVNYGKKFSGYKGWIIFLVWTILVFLSSKSWPMKESQFYHSYLSFSDIGYFSDDWAFGVLWLGVFLFFIMVLVVGIAGKFKGALIMKG